MYDVLTLRAFSACIKLHNVSEKTAVEYPHESSDCIIIHCFTIFKEKLSYYITFCIQILKDDIVTVFIYQSSLMT